MWVLYGKISDELVFGSPCPTSKVAEVNAAYQLVNFIICEISDPALCNSVFGPFMRRSRTSSYLCHLDLIPRLLRSTPYIDLLTFTCEHDNF